MLSALFEKIGLIRESLWTYEGLDLQAFKGMATCPSGYVKLMIFVGEGNDIQSVNSQFLVLSYRRIYNCILERPCSHLGRCSFNGKPQAQVPQYSSRTNYHQCRSQESNNNLSRTPSKPMRRQSDGNQRGIPERPAQKHEHPSPPKVVKLTKSKIKGISGG